MRSQKFIVEIDNTDDGTLDADEIQKLIFCTYSEVYVTVREEK